MRAETTSEHTPLSQAQFQELYRELTGDLDHFVFQAKDHPRRALALLETLDSLVEDAKQEIREELRG